MEQSCSTDTIPFFLIKPALNSKYIAFSRDVLAIDLAATLDFQIYGVCGIKGVAGKVPNNNEELL